MTDAPTAWRVPGYVEERELGAGAQGRVVLAVDEHSGEEVAIKYLAADLLSSPFHLQMFAREAELLRRVTNPHVARLHSFIQGPDGAAIVMEAIDGASLRAVLAERSGMPLTPEEALVTLKGSLLGLTAAHAVGVVHRDYKPANVVVQPDGSSKLIDFGISVLYGESSRAGTPAYMSPEQWRGDPASPATDVYAAACVFYECVTGSKPFRSVHSETLMAEHTSVPVPVETVPESLRPLVRHGMAKDPAERPAGAADFLAELEEVASLGYGPDWERIGLAAMGSGLAAVATAASTAAVASAVLGHGAAAGTVAHATGSTAAAHTAAHAGQQAAHTVAGKGALAKVGGAKGAAGIAGGVAVATVATVLVLNGQSDPPALSYAQARRVLTSYLATVDRAYAALDGDLLARADAEPFLGVERAALTWARTYHQPAPTGAVWRNPTFWIPRIHGGRQRWFAAMAGTGSGKGIPGLTIIFAGQRAGWRAVMASYPPDGRQRYPRVTLDQQGYATEVRPDDTHYRIPPGGLSERLTADQNAALRNGGKLPAGSPFSEGRCTSQLAKKVLDGRASAAKFGWAAKDVSFAFPTPVFALKASTGAIVWLTQRRTSRLVQTRSGTNDYYRPTFPGSEKVAAVHFRHSMDLDMLAQAAAVDPPGRTGRVDVIHCDNWLRDFSGT
ncbi:protein kinase domain-containing protein [Actinomadura scrupuli]|uniref:protein kinase domain-containing protein n=1 Tax=Actinomadura scrupuli TaxID=559629 RepID=UPI003D988124